MILIMDETFLEAESSFTMLGLSFSFRLDWGFSINSVSKIAYINTGVLIHSGESLPSKALFSNLKSFRVLWLNPQMLVQHLVVHFLWGNAWLLVTSVSPNCIVDEFIFLFMVLLCKLLWLNPKALGKHLNCSTISQKC